ncbi:hypothetical protein KTJ16_00405 [Acinetobacter bereziniae]|uniref:hypothetical protein n=1 Tax=Acinetobacter bereziniae TaxID=106648 RepID=UPI0021CD990F|nr:hypothetical protein [Acinetobacter bereziniae]MCU4539641.1 hypothetical protein [Acinetobacter bereziniae]MCU4624180.1 hypothetical protein [Acinetobacter bereziniae]
MRQFFFIPYLLSFFSLAYAGNSKDFGFEIEPRKVLIDSNGSLIPVDDNPIEENSEIQSQSKEKSISGRKIYVLKDEHGNALLSNSEKFDEKLKQIRVISYPESELYKDGWRFIKCEKDRFNNSKYCGMINKDLLVSIYNGKFGILIGGNHYPRSRSALKFDNGKTYYGYEGEFKNEAIFLNLLLNGKTAYTRYMEWPYQLNIDNEISLDGFSEAYQELKNRYSKL